MPQPTRDSCTAALVTALAFLGIVTASPLGAQSVDTSPTLGTATGTRWSSSAAPDEDSPTAWHRDVATNRNSIWRSPVNVTYWLSVRCVAER